MPLLIAAGIGAAISAYGAYQGHKQKKEGEKALSGLTAPTYEIPQEIYDNLSDAERMDVEGLPAAQKKAFVQNIDRSQQQALKSQADRKGGLLGIQQSMQNETDAFSNLTSMDAAAYQQSKMNKQSSVERARLGLAQAKDKKFGIQKGDYEADLASAQGMIGAGQQNFMQGIQGIGAAGMSAATMGMGNPLGGGGSSVSPQSVSSAANIGQSVSKIPPGMLGAQP
jgi:hypothetical protein